MPRQNRITPFGDIIATPARGQMMGNRGGCLHDEHGELTQRRWTNSAWISCVLEWKGYRQTINAPGKYTQLFFLDEATAMAAGHRPCAQCRRDAFNRFKAAWAGAFPDRGTSPRAPEMDMVLQSSRIDRVSRAQVRYKDSWRDLPDFAFFTDEASQTAYMKRNDKALPWSVNSYGDAILPPRETVMVLTPRPLVDVLRAGYVPYIAAD